jgi:hypothetical protein
LSIIPDISGKICSGVVISVIVACVGGGGKIIGVGCGIVTLVFNI